MVFIHNIRGQTGVWREHLQLLKGLLDTVHLFYIPEIHCYLVPMLFDYVLTGNNETKEVSCHLLAKILRWQHHSASRDELLAQIQSQLFKSNNWKQRRSFIFVCKYAIRLMSRDFFKRHFIREYMALASDRVPHVRMEFVNSLLVIKPYFDIDESEQELSLELVDLLNALMHDQDRDVVEAAEHTDFELLNMKRRLKKEKKTQVNDDEEPDEVRVAWQKGLAVREKEEAEERKKR